MKDIKVVLERALDVIGLYAPNHEILEQISDILASEQEPVAINGFLYEDAIYIVGHGWQCDEMPPLHTKLYIHPSQDKINEAALAERERCALICDNLVIEHVGRADLTADQCAKAIRGE